MGARENTHEIGAETIYAKTRAGKAVLADKARLPQRHLCTMLVLVDGRSTVAELSARLGGVPVAAVLLELATLGYIAPLDSHATNLNAGRIYPEKPSAARPEKTRSSAGGDGAGARARRSPRVSHGEELRAEQAVHRDTARPSAASRGKPLGTRPRAADTRSVRLRERVQPAGRRSLGLRLGAAAVLVAVLGAGVLYGYPVGRHASAIQARAEAITGLPVRVADVRLELWPRPALRLDQVAIGSDAPIRARSVRLGLRPAMSLDEVVRPEIWRVEGLELDAAARAGLLPWLSGQRGYGPQSPRLVEIRDMTLRLGSAAVGGLEGRIRLQGRDPAEIRLNDGADALRIRLNAEREDFGFALDAEQWAPAAFNAIRFERLDVRGTLKGPVMLLSRVDGQVFGAAFSGRGEWEWGRQQRLAGDLRFQRVELSRLLSPTPYARLFDGEAAVQFGFTANAGTLDGLAAALQGAGTVRAQTGTLTGFDLAEAVRGTSGAAGRGGRTRFESLKAAFEFSPAQGKLTDVVLNSGLLVASGGLNVGSRRDLSGNFLVEIRSATNPVRAPVGVAGTLADPRIVRPGGP